jgi:hypothetical protein
MQGRRIPRPNRKTHEAVLENRNKEREREFGVWSLEIGIWNLEFGNKKSPEIFGTFCYSF